MISCEKVPLVWRFLIRVSYELNKEGETARKDMRLCAQPLRQLDKQGQADDQVKWERNAQ